LDRFAQNEENILSPASPSAGRKVELPTAGNLGKELPSAGANVQTCTRCCINSTVAGVKFDARGECNFCTMHDELERAYPIDEPGTGAFGAAIEKIKADGRGKKYDCVLGVSGGRDSSYTLWLLKQQGLRPLAVHFNDGFGNPVAGKNMTRAAQALKVDLRTITSDWRESKDLRIAFLRASTPDFGMPTDLGIAAALYAVATKENLHYVVIGQSFRTEGICPLEWLYFEGKYLKEVHRRFGKVPLRPWKPEDPGFNLGIPEFCYYAFIRRIKTFLPLYHLRYVRDEVDDLLIRELGWVYPGAHYYDDLYQSLMTYILRVKFGIDRRIFNYAALVRSGQMNREEAIGRVREVYVIEDPKVIQLCIKRLGLTQEEFNEIIALPPKTFHDYPTNYAWLRRFKFVVRMMANLQIVPKSTYMKYFDFC